MQGLTAREIRGDIESRIAAGHLAAGDRLPSVRELAANLDVSPATVSSAYRELRLRGLVVGRGRQGTSVAPARRDAAAYTPESIPGLIDAASGSPDPRLLPPLGAALEFAATLPQAAYGGPLFDERLLTAAQMNFSADNIVASHLAVTSGAMDAVERVLNALDLRIGDRIGVEDPGHVPVHQLVRSSGLKLVPLPVDDLGITPEGLDTALSDGLAAVIATPRAHNPTGAAFDAARAMALSEQLESHPAVAVIQDDHAGLIAGTACHPIIATGSRWATIRSMGKAFGPDLRVAILTADQVTVDRVSIGLANGPGWVSFLLQRVSAYLLGDPSTLALITEAEVSYETRRRAVIGELAKHGVAATGRSGLNVWIPTEDEHRSIEAARNAGFAIRAAAPYRIDSPPAVRISISHLDHSHAAELAEALARANTTRLHAPAM